MSISALPFRQRPPQEREQLDDLIAATHLKLDEQAIHRLDSASAY